MHIGWRLMVKIALVRCALGRPLIKRDYQEFRAWGSIVGAEVIPYVREEETTPDIVGSFGPVDR